VRAAVQPDPAATGAGQALLFGQFSLLRYAAAGSIVTASFVRWYEEPAHTRTTEEHRRPFAVPSRGGS